MFWYCVLACLVISALGVHSFDASAALRSRSRRSLAMTTPIGTVQLAVEKRNVERTEVIRALQEIERKAKTGSVREEDLNGRFDLVFTNAPNAFEGGFLVGGSINGYFGMKETLCIDLKKKIIILEGPLWSRYKGKCSYNKGGIDYTFEDFKVGPIGQDGMGVIDRRYSFFSFQEGLALARIEPSGALAVLKKL